MIITGHEKKIEWLRQYTNLVKVNGRLRVDIARIDSACVGTRSAAMEAMLYGLEDEIYRNNVKMIKIERAISSVSDPRLYKLLHSRYVCGLKWRTISETLGYSEMQVMKLHDEAIQLLTIPDS